MSKSGAIKFDTDKPPLAILDKHLLLEMAMVMQYGARKYGMNNWREGHVYSRVLSACLRHIYAFLGGEDNDPETQFSHLAHAGCCLMMLLGNIREGAGMDDRYKKGDAGVKLQSAIQEVLSDPNFQKNLSKAGLKEMVELKERFKDVRSDAGRA